MATVTLRNAKQSSGVNTATLLLLLVLLPPKVMIFPALYPTPKQTVNVTKTAAAVVAFFVREVDCPAPFCPFFE